MKQKWKNIMKKLSIIVPVYNTGEYLYKCIDSILAQTISDIEVIIIDDGSEEKTAKICKEIASSDSRIQLVHKKNEGVSVARNVGLELATGEYVGFVDSDDWIEANMYETLIKELETNMVDIVMCDATTIHANRKTDLDTFLCLPNSCILSRKEITPVRLLELAGASWRVLYRTRLLREFGIMFPVGIKFSEDRIFNMIALGASEKFCYVKKSFYNRFLREGSCVMSYHPDFVNVTLCVNDIMKEVLLKYWNENYIYAFEERNLKGIGYNTLCLFNTSSLCWKEKIETVEAICHDYKLQNILARVAVSDLSLSYIKNRNILGLYFLSLIKKIKNIVRIVFLKLSSSFKKVFHEKDFISIWNASRGH